MPSTPLPYVLGAVSLLLGITIGCAVVYALCTAGFWLVETRGLQVLYMVLSGFLAGLFVPIDLFPDWLRTLAEATPFPSMLMYPIDILSGRATGADAVLHVGIQAFWLALLVVGGHLLTRAGRHRLEVQGG
jgi:ABC-2 type transport system permease protein